MAAAAVARTTTCEASRRSFPMRAARRTVATRQVAALRRADAAQVAMRVTRIDPRLRLGQGTTEPQSPVLPAERGRRQSAVAGLQQVLAAAVGRLAVLSCQRVALVRSGAGPQCLPCTGHQVGLLAQGWRQWRSGRRCIRKRHGLGSGRRHQRTGGPPGAPTCADSPAPSTR